MENREKDRAGKRTSSTESGDMNRQSSEKMGREQNSGTSAEFGQGIGRSEKLSEGGEMNKNQNRNQSDDMNRNVPKDSGRSSGSEGYGSSSGRSSGSSGSDVSSGSSERSGSKESGNVGRSSEGEH